MQKTRKCDPQRSYSCGRSCITKRYACRIEFPENVSISLSESREVINIGYTKLRIPETITDKSDLFEPTKEWQYRRGFQNDEHGEYAEFMDAHDGDHILTYSINEIDGKQIQGKYGWPGRNAKTTSDSTPTIAEEQMVRAMGVAALKPDDIDLDTYINRTWGIPEKNPWGTYDYQRLTSASFVDSLAKKHLKRDSEQRSYYEDLGKQKQIWSDMVRENFTNLERRSDKEKIKELVRRTYVLRDGGVENGSISLLPNSQKFVQEGWVAFQENSDKWGYQFYMDFIPATLTGDRSSLLEKYG